jgi:hypothetical protein
MLQILQLFLWIALCRMSSARKVLFKTPTNDHQINNMDQKVNTLDTKSDTERASNNLRRVESQSSRNMIKSTIESYQSFDLMDCDSYDFIW